MADTLRAAGTCPGNPAATCDEVSFLCARVANEEVKAQIGKVWLEKMKAEVIDRAENTAIEQVCRTAHGVS